MRVQNFEVVIKIATGLEELKEAMSLVYNAYLCTDLIKPNKFKVHITPYHLLKTTEVFITMVNNSVVSTLTIIRNGELGLPIQHSFNEESTLCCERGTVCGEVSCLANKYASVSSIMRLIGFAKQCAKYRGVEEILIAVHPKHSGFYERFIGFKQIGSERPYQRVCNKPAIAMSLDLSQTSIHSNVAYEKLFGKPFSISDIQYRPVSDHILDELSKMI